MVLLHSARACVLKKNLCTKNLHGFLHGFKWFYMWYCVLVAGFSFEQTFSTVPVLKQNKGGCTTLHQYCDFWCILHDLLFGSQKKICERRKTEKISVISSFCDSFRSWLWHFLSKKWSSPGVLPNMVKFGHNWQNCIYTFCGSVIFPPKNNPPPPNVKTPSGSWNYRPNIKPGGSYLGGGVGF